MTIINISDKEIWYKFYGDTQTPSMCTLEAIDFIFQSIELLWSF